MAELHTDLQASDQAADGGTSCAHQWSIESPSGPTSPGTCKVCGETREFRNSIPGGGWDRGQGQARRKANAARQARMRAAGKRKPASAG